MKNFIDTLLNVSKTAIVTIVYASIAILIMAIYCEITWFITPELWKAFMYVIDAISGWLMLAGATMLFGLAAKNDMENVEE